jgi:hypothetical protein
MEKTMKTLTTKEVKTARIVAVSADAMQFFLAPFFVEGIASPFNDILDVVVCIVLSNIIGWHWAFVPSAFIEEIPGVDLAPTWTIAVFYATRNETLLTEN